MMNIQSGSELDYDSDSSTASSESENRFDYDNSRNDVAAYLRNELKAEPTEAEIQDYLHKHNPGHIYKMLLDKKDKGSSGIKQKKLS